MAPYHDKYIPGTQYPALWKAPSSPAEVHLCNIRHLMITRPPCPASVAHGLLLLTSCHVIEISFGTNLILSVIV